jgi:hypothetical protein
MADDAEDVSVESLMIVANRRSRFALSWLCEGVSVSVGIPISSVLCIPLTVACHDDFLPMKM